MAQQSPNRPARTVVIAAGLWRGFEVSIEPPVSSHPLRRFQSHADAVEWAETFAGANGWPVVDRTVGEI